MQGTHKVGKGFFFFLSVLLPIQAIIMDLPGPDVGTARGRAWCKAGGSYPGPVSLPGNIRPLALLVARCGVSAVSWLSLPLHTSMFLHCLGPVPL